MKRLDRRSRKTLVSAVAAVLAVGLLAGSFLFMFERVEEEIDVGLQGEARSNPLLASEKLFAALGMPARSVRGALHLPPPDHALFLLNPRRNIRAPTANRILEWVIRGGHLIVTPRYRERYDPSGEEAAGIQSDGGRNEEMGGPWDEDDPVLDPFDIVVERPQRLGREVLRVAAAPGLRPLEVAMAHSPRLEDLSGEASFSAGPSEGKVMVRYDLGQGRVTVLSDASFLRNENLGERDHARFAWSLLTAGAPPAGVWLVYGDQVPSLVGWVLRHAWTVVASGTLILALWLWRSGFSFGPRLPEPPKARRSLLEHVEASGELLWRRASARVLLEGTRAALLRRVERRSPGFSTLAESQQTQELARLAKVPTEEVESVLRDPAGRPGRRSFDPMEFTRLIRALEKIRSSL